MNAYADQNNIENGSPQEFDGENHSSRGNNVENGNTSQHDTHEATQTLPFSYACLTITQFNLPVDASLH